MRKNGFCSITTRTVNSDQGCLPGIMYSGADIMTNFMIITLFVLFKDMAVFPGPFPPGTASLGAGTRLPPHSAVEVETRNPEGLIHNIGFF